MSSTKECLFVEFDKKDHLYMNTQVEKKEKK